MIETFDNHTPDISRKAFVHRSACISGDVRIADYSIVRSNTSVIGDNGSIVIGSRSVIEEGCVLHVGNFAAWEQGSASTMHLGERVIIGHGAVVHARTVGDRVLIGINASVLENVEIGDDCIIAAGAVVREGSIIPSRSRVAGVPATIKGPVSDSQLPWLSDGDKLNDDYFKHESAKLQAATIADT